MFETKKRVFDSFYDRFKDVTTEDIEALQYRDKRSSATQQLFSAASMTKSKLNKAEGDLIETGAIKREDTSRRFHFLVLGGKEVGKTAFMKSYCGDQHKKSQNPNEKSSQLDSIYEKQIQVPEEATIVLHEQIQVPFRKNILSIVAVAIILVNLNNGLKKTQE